MPHRHGRSQHQAHTPLRLLQACPRLDSAWSRGGYKGGHSYLDAHPRRKRDTSFYTRGFQLEDERTKIAIGPLKDYYTYLLQATRELEVEPAALHSPGDLGARRIRSIAAFDRTCIVQDGGSIESPHQRVLDLHLDRLYRSE
jgi:hypothetical protein